MSILFCVQQVKTSFDKIGPVTAVTLKDFKTRVKKVKGHLSVLLRLSASEYHIGALRACVAE